MPTEFLQKKIQIFSQDFLGTHWKNMSFIPMKSNKNQSISYNNSGVTTNKLNNSGVITSQIELINLTKARKSKKQSSFWVKYCKGLFFFLIFFPLLPVLPPASFSPLLFFVKNLFELPGHVCYRFIHVNNISSLKTEAIS